MSPIERSSGGGGGGLTAIPNARFTGNNAGDFTTASAVFVDMGISASIAAATGDVLFVTFALDFSINAAPPVNAFFKLVTTTGGNLVTNNGPQELANAGKTSNTLAALYTVVAGDISGGNVAVKVQWATGAATITGYNSGSDVPHLALLNLKQ